MKLLFRVLIALFFLAATVSADQLCRVRLILDGDTFICQSGDNVLKVRLIGIDAPECKINEHMERQKSRLGNLDEQTILKLGGRAKGFVSVNLRVGTNVRLEFDVQKRDKYGRILAYVWLPNGRMLNELMLREGHAMLMIIPPNVKYEDTLKQAYDEAVQERKGIWAEVFHACTSPAGAAKIAPNPQP